MKAALTEKLLRSLLAKGPPQPPIWDRLLPGLEARTGKRAISCSIVGRPRGSTTRQPMRLLAGHFPMMSVGEIRARGRTLLRQLQDGIDPRALPSAFASSARLPSSSSSTWRARILLGRSSCASDAS